jgi:hypothetical protein
MNAAGPQILYLMNSARTSTYAITSGCESSHNLRALDQHHLFFLDLLPKAKHTGEEHGSGVEAGPRSKQLLQANSVLILRDSSGSGE